MTGFARSLYDSGSWSLAFRTVLGSRTLKAGCKLALSKKSRQLRGLFIFYPRPLASSAVRLHSVRSFRFDCSTLPCSSLT